DRLFSLAEKFHKERGIREEEKGAKGKKGLQLWQLRLGRKKEEKKKRKEEEEKKKRGRRRGRREERRKKRENAAAGGLRIGEKKGRIEGEK
ncbi:hypothetical protein GW17_00055436, partial [Ensete ventricosum]